jgi:hypothetical protein
VTRKFAPPNKTIAFLKEPLHLSDINQLSATNYLLRRSQQYLNKPYSAFVIHYKQPIQAGACVEGFGLHSGDVPVRMSDGTISTMCEGTPRKLATATQPQFPIIVISLS